MYSDKDSCTERNNGACSPCNLWNRYLATPAAQQSCKQEMTVAGHWCDRREWVTVVQVQQDHYVALPNQAVTGVEEAFKVDGAHLFIPQPCPLSDLLQLSPSGPSFTPNSQCR